VTVQLGLDHRPPDRAGAHLPGWRRMSVMSLLTTVADFAAFLGRLVTPRAEAFDLKPATRVEMRKLIAWGCTWSSKTGSGGSGHAHKSPDPQKFFPTKMRITMIQVSAGSTYDPKLVPNLPAKK
jgi:hypothetical protein